MDELLIQALVKRSGEKYIFIFREDRWKEVVKRIVDMRWDKDLSLNYQDMVRLVKGIKKQLDES